MTTAWPAPSERVAWQVVHGVPGRLRVRYPVGWLRRDGAALTARLRAIAGVRAISLSPATGSVRIDYDPRRLTRGRLESLLAGISGRPAAVTAVTAPAGIADVVAATATLAAAWLPLAAPVRAAVLLAATVPAVARAIGAVGASRAVGGEVLEAATLLLLAGRGQATAAGALLAFRALGDVVVTRTRGRARRSLRGLVAPWERTAWRRDGDETPVPFARLRAGDVIVVGEGHTMPVDGAVVRGAALVDQQTMTGEGLPVERRPGDPVFAATSIHQGEVAVRVDRLGDDTAIGRIVRAVELAAGEPSEIQHAAQSLADAQAPRTLVLAGLGTVVAASLDSGVAILVADYGMAARVGIPVALASALTAGAREGLLIKGTRVLESLARVDTVVFDKTGTLTSGVPAVTRVVALAGWTEHDVIRLCAAAESGFRHPVARAVARLAAERHVTVPSRDPAVTVVGLGVETRVDGAHLLVGSRRFLEERGVDLAGIADDEAAAHALGGAPAFLAVDDRVVGLLVLHDALRSDAAALLEALRARGIRDVVMVTGDHEGPTRVIAGALGVTEYHSDVMPDDKAHLIRRLRARGRVVAMVGDGVNDALALSEADVGIAVHGGVDVVAEAADVVLLRGGLEGVVGSLDLARGALLQVRRTVRMAARANLLVVGLASMGLAPPALSVLLTRGAALGSALSTLSRAQAAAQSRARS